MLGKTIKKAYAIDAGITNSHNLHNTSADKLQKCADLKEELIRIRQLKAVYIVPLVLSRTGIIPNILTAAWNWSFFAVVCIL
jgi:hypothetical protein